ncbi:transcription initiation factor TFIID subunit 1-like isoform X2 [Artemia franciscana]|uniref:Transcription initiation factor TFIID subunit 1 n=2 Tax=Artemia franciscana TaxID=6661 RepID=A0AA88I6E3_ARTSF|nr:hypothetical protein QYM36_004581 [Artemia franciscana]KAK2720742.1 hypothetical protein QYM36_004581 [Artemia franciscana]
MGESSDDDFKSDQSDLEEELENQPGINLTGFLFGNIDSNGQLDGDIFDDSAKKCLNSLSSFGLGTIVKEVVEDEVLPDEETEIGDKSPSAIDYFDIIEVAEDCSVEESEADEVCLPKNDSVLMPPPLHRDTLSNNGDYQNRKIITPLAAMLPSKYADIDVNEIFPDFKPDKVLRFSKLFGPGKPSSLPQIWRHVRKRQKRWKAEESRKRKEKTDEGEQEKGNEEEDDEQNLNKGWDFNFGPSPVPQQVREDSSVKFLSDLETVAEKDSDTEKAADDRGPSVADWRYGPAQLWYDMLDVPDTGDGFDYGFKLKQVDDLGPKPEAAVSEVPPRETKEDAISDDAFLMVTQMQWEEDVILNSEEQKSKVLTRFNNKSIFTGWMSNGPSKFVPATITVSKPMSSSVIGPLSKPDPAVVKTSNSKKEKHASYAPEYAQEDIWWSVFPAENDELTKGLWEEDIIWDPECMDKIPKPKVVTLDMNDDNIILGIPDDIDPRTLEKSDQPPVKIKIPHPHVKKSKMLLGRSGIINVIEEDTPLPPSEDDDKDPFNISNDEYYQPKVPDTAIKSSAAGQLIQHSTPVVELRPPLIPTYMGPTKLRQFHRPPLKRITTGPLSTIGHHQVQPLTKHIKKMAQQREQDRIAAGGGDIFYMRTLEDLSGKDGELILTEYCEEHPPLLSQVGMCTRAKNYYKRKVGVDTGPPELPYGELALAHTSPFLGTLHPGQCISAIENNMYRAPMYHHENIPTDFLIIRTRNGYYIREYDALFTIGQECPLYEVFGPNSKRANNFIRDFLQVFIFRLFWRSRDNPRRIRMDDIKKAFPSHSESSIRKRLKLCAEFRRTGLDSNWWVLKPDFRLQTEEELRAIVSPEQCCAFLSMIAAEQRLKDAGYGEKFMLTQDDDDDEDLQLKMDDEIKVAPWNTTKAYIHAMKNKCLLQLTGPADPTGCGEGFSYVRVPNKPTVNKEEVEQQPKRIVSGTTADLRRLPLNEARGILRKFGVPEDEIKKLSRWEVIDVVRTLSTEKAKAGEEGMDMFSRGNRFSIAEHQERYKEECQRIFELQNRVLASEEVLSTDEGESSEEEELSDLEEMGKNIESMLVNKKSHAQLSLEREEQERRELQRMILGELEPDSKKKKKDAGDELGAALSSHPNRILKIFRTFKTEDGREYVRCETVRKPIVIDTYVKIRQTKDDSFIRQFAAPDETAKESLKKEKRRQQEQMRREKRKGDKDTVISPVKKFKKPKIDSKVKCSTCGQTGHMRTNKACPMYQGGKQPINVAMTEEQEEIMERQLAMDEDEGLVNVEGTKVKLSSKVLKHAEEVKRKSLLLKVPKDAIKRRKRGGGVTDDYLKRPDKTAQRKRSDPLVTMATVLEEFLNEMRELPDTQPFLFPVNQKTVSDYCTIVQNPMDLQTMREKVRSKAYHSREEFLADVTLIFENSKRYNGPNHLYTLTAKSILELCIQRFKEKEDKLIRIEKAINPLLDDDDQVAFTYILENILNTRLTTLPESGPFLKPVSRKSVKDYYEVVKDPMDLETITRKVKANKYHNREDFLRDVEQIVKNSLAYNGETHPVTAKAKKVYDTAVEALKEFSDNLDHLEAGMKEAQARALEQSDADWEDEEEGFSREGMMKGRGRGRGGKGRGGMTKRGRPKTGFMGESSATSEDVLQQDLQFSSESEEEDDQDFEAVTEGDFSSDNIGVLVAGESSSLLHKEASPLKSEVKEESMEMDIDNYDPAAELLAGTMGTTSHLPRTTIKDDLEISESDEEDPLKIAKTEEDDEDGLWF